MIRRDKKWLTDILDQYRHAVVKEPLFDDKYYKTETKMYYLVQNKSHQYILKACKCCIGDTEGIAQIKVEYELSSKMYSNTPNALKPMDIREKKDEEKGVVYVESLHEHEGKQLIEQMKELTPMEVFDIAGKLLESLVIMEDLKFHCDITPFNILYGNKTVKLIDFMTYKEIESKLKNIKTIKVLNKENVGYTFGYGAPELYRKYQIYSPEKIDVYCWAITIYQLFTKKTRDELEVEAIQYKGLGRDYTKFIDLIKSNNFKCEEHEDFIKQVLVQALDEDPNKRPTFSELKLKFATLDPLAIHIANSPLNNNNQAEVKDEREELKGNAVRICEEVKEKVLLPRQLLNEYNELKARSARMEEVVCELENSYLPLQEEWNNQLEITGLLNAKDRMNNIDFLNLSNHISNMPFIILKKEELKAKYIKKTKESNDMKSMFEKLEGVRNKQICNEVVKIFNSLLKDKLKNLDMWDKDISDIGAQIIAKGIIKTKNLMRINLAYCRIETQGMKALGQALKSKEALVALILGSSQSNRNCMMHNFLYGSNSYHDIALMENRIEGEGAKAIAEVLTTCKSLFNISVGFCNTNREEDQLIILQAVNKNLNIEALHIWGYNKEIVKSYLRRNLIVYGP